MFAILPQRFDGAAASPDCVARGSVSATLLQRKKSLHSKLINKRERSSVAALALGLCCTLCMSAAQAQNAASADALANVTANPIADLIFLPLQSS